MSKYTFSTPVKKPAARAEMPLQAEKPVATAGWRTTTLACSTVLFAVLWLSAIWPTKAGGDADHGENVEGVYVALFYDDEQADDLSRDQLEFLNSADVAEYLDGKADGWMKIDVSQVDDINSLPPAYAKLESHHRSKLPWIAAAKGRKFISEPIENRAQAMNALKRILE